MLPRFDIHEAAALAHRLFALEGPLKLLNGERDLNFLISDARGKFVFKIANAEESASTLECQHRVFDRLAQAKAFPLVARALPSREGREIDPAAEMRVRARIHSGRREVPHKSTKRGGTGGLRAQGGWWGLSIRRA